MERDGVKVNESAAALTVLTGSGGETGELTFGMSSAYFVLTGEMTKEEEYGD